MLPILKNLALGTIAMSLSFAAHTADYVIDTKGSHAFIQFRVKHLGYSWLYGRFNTFSGGFSYDESDPANNRIEVRIQTASVDSNHAERDKHLRGDEFLDVKKFPEARFVSTAYEDRGNGKGQLTGDFTLRGVTRSLTLEIEQVGTGEDPWGGYRRGFTGRARFALADFGITKNLGPASKEVELILDVEGIRQ